MKKSLSEKCDLEKYCLLESIDLFLVLEEDIKYILIDNKETRDFIKRKYGNLISDCSKKGFEKFYESVKDKFISLLKSELSELNKTEIIETRRKSSLTKVQNERGETWYAEVRSISRLIKRFS